MLIVIKLLIKKLKIPTRMAYLISIGSTVCGTTAIMATAPVIGAKKNEVAYAIANITLFGILSMLIYPYFANFYFESEPLLIGLFYEDENLGIGSILSSDTSSLDKFIEQKLKEGCISLQEQSKVHVNVNPSVDHVIKEGEKALLIP